MNNSEEANKNTNVGAVIGIDLGTTNSAVGENGKIIPNDRGKNTTPSVVYFSPEGQIIVGESAKNEIVINPDRVVYEVKRLIGRKFEDPEVQEFIKKCPYKIVPGNNGEACIEIGKERYSPIQISAFILQKMKKISEEFIGKKVNRAVITVPAYFNDAQRQATKDAGAIAGLQVERIINEPTAASLSYGVDKSKKQGTIAVFDLGGGTFDISIINIEEGLFEVKATNGDTYLGGANFDQKIIEWLINKAKEKWGIDLGKDKLALQRLKEAAEKAKQELSSLTATTINLPFITADASGPKHLVEQLLRKEFENLTKDLLDKLVIPCKNCLKDAGVSKIDEIILVGGMTRMPAVQDKVKEIFNKEPSKSVNPDEAVAIGAAIQGSVLAGDTKDILLLDVTPLSLGIEVEGGLNHILIPRNTTIPTEKEEVFSTATDNQPSVFVRVIQGESPKASSPANKVLGTFELTGIKPAPRGIPQIAVKFAINSDSIVSVSAKDKSTGKEQTITVSESSKLSEEEIQRMTKEAQTREKEDEEFKNNVELLNRAQTYCYTFEKQIADFKKNNLQNEPQFQEFEKLYTDLKKSTEEKDYTSLKQQIDKIDELMKLSNELMQKMPSEEKKEDEDTLDVQPETDDKDKK